MNFATGVAPGAPNAGDLWFDGTYLYLRAAGINQPLNAPFGTGTPNVLTKWSSVSGLTDTAITEASGAIRTLTLTTPGTGYANQTSVALTGGSGTGATASITVTGGAVAWVNLLDPGSGYTAGNVLTISGGGGNATVTVSATVAKDDASGNLSAQRVGAGTAQPNAGLDSRLGALVTGWQRGVYSIQDLINPLTLLNTAVIGDDVDLATTGGATSYIARVTKSRISTTGGGQVRAFQENATVTASAGSSTLTIQGGNINVYRLNPLDTNTAAIVRGLQVSCSLFTTGGAASFTNSTMEGFVAGCTVNAAGSTTTVRDMQTTGFLASGHTIGTWTSYRCTQPNAQAGAICPQYTGIHIDAAGNAAATYTLYYGVRIGVPNSIITTQWGVSQESTTAKNQFLGNVASASTLAQVR